MPKVYCKTATITTTKQNKKQKQKLKANKLAQIISFKKNSIILFSPGAYCIFPPFCDFKVYTEFTRGLKYNLFLVQNLATQLVALF